jgi:predicted nucleotidyltransferase
MNDLQSIFVKVVETLVAKRVDFLLIGGMAVNHYGFTRATADIDFMLAMRDASLARTALSRAGFSNIVEHENVLFLHWPNQPVRVDLLKVDVQTFEQLLQRSVTVCIHHLTLRIPALEDLIAMKFFAWKNGGVRRMAKDMMDIVQLACIHELDLDTQVRPLALRFADEALYGQVKALVVDWRRDETAPHN